MNTKTEYENKSLSDYKANFLWRDRIRYGLANLQAADKDDLEQELYLTLVSLITTTKNNKPYFNNKYLQVPTAKRQIYCNKAFQNTIKRFARQYIKGNRIKKMTEQELIKWLDSADWDDGAGTIAIQEMAILQCLTTFERDVVALKACGIPNKEIHRLLKYDGKIEALKKVFIRAKTKVLKKHAEKMEK